MPENPASPTHPSRDTEPTVDETNAELRKACMTTLRSAEKTIDQAAKTIENATALKSTATAMLRLLGCIAFAFLCPSCIGSGGISYDALHNTWQATASWGKQPVLAP
jgi:hypothetical protein